jgi:hypothetical protein
MIAAMNAISTSPFPFWGKVRIGTVFPLRWLASAAAEGLLLFCLIKKVTKKSRLGTDVG